tara:strand:- start:402 stop:518 length:117 start_codon:yes stop_codon:yes gene_type:complete
MIAVGKDGGEQGTGDDDEKRPGTLVQSIVHGFKHLFKW